MRVRVPYSIARFNARASNCAGGADQRKDQGEHDLKQAPPISVTVRAGVTSLSGQDMQADSMLARADDALYRAKQQGWDRVVTVK
jgi:PleD family two-component response regulator